VRICDGVKEVEWRRKIRKERVSGQMVSEGRVSE
jgi:hypothetical protein